MKRTIRIGMFETNSSSTHALAFISEEQYQGVEDGSLVIAFDPRYLGYDGSQPVVLPREEVVRHIHERDQWYDDIDESGNLRCLCCCGGEELDYVESIVERVPGTDTYAVSVYIDPDY